MSYTKEKIEKILQQGETEQVEFKAMIPDPLIFSKVIGAFANSNGGTIIVGVEEPNRVIGCDYNRLQNLLGRTKDLLNPVPRIEISQIEFEGKTLGIIEVEKSANLTFAAGGIYERQGEMIRTMTPLELKNKIVQFAKPENQDFLAKALNKQTEIIEELRDEIRTSNSFKSKLKDYLIGGLIGAILGLLLTLLFAG